MINEREEEYKRTTMPPEHWSHINMSSR
jgi:hypothetical protein